MIDIKDPRWGERLPEPEPTHPSEIYGKSHFEESYIDFEPNHLDPEYLDKDPRKLQVDYLDLDEDSFRDAEIEQDLLAEMNYEPLDEEAELEDDSTLGIIHEELADHTKEITALQKKISKLEQDRIKDSFRHSKIIVEFQRLQRVVKTQEKELHDVSKYKRYLAWLKRNHDDVVNGKLS